jgi:hypothetical protein
MFQVKSIGTFPEFEYGWGKLPVPNSGNLLHELERQFSLIFSVSNLHSATTNEIGLTR